MENPVKIWCFNCIKDRKSPNVSGLSNQHSIIHSHWNLYVLLTHQLYFHLKKKSVFLKRQLTQEGTTTKIYRRIFRFDQLNRELGASTAVRLFLLNIYVFFGTLKIVWYLASSLMNRLLFIYCDDNDGLNFDLLYLSTKCYMQIKLMAKCVSMIPNKCNKCVWMIFTIWFFQSFDFVLLLFFFFFLFARTIQWRF